MSQERRRTEADRNRSASRTPVRGSAAEAIEGVADTPHADHSATFPSLPAWPTQPGGSAAAGSGATCRSCASCPWMAMNALDNLAQVLEEGSSEVFVDTSLGEKAMKPLTRMLNFSAQKK